MSTFIDNYSELLQYCAILSVCTFVISLIIIPWIIIRLPSDFFSTPKTIWNGARQHHPVLVISLIIIKNCIGFVLLIAGIAMLVLPGQGLITIAISIGLINFPGKHRLLSRIVEIPTVFKTLNWIREKSCHPPFIRPQTHHCNVQ